ncbi:HD domain-containing phosphohydrolase [Leeia sp.]|uniref:HD domain-containing phosphohydrolase n=1 Tax=Leeia sp. TaxID=2884678 RepID=UPI0035AE09B6
MDYSRTNFALLPEVIDLMAEAVEHIERDLNLLVHDPGHLELLRDVFREVHSIKGNFAMCQSQTLTQFGHAIENVLAAMKEQHFSCTALVAEALLLSLDRLREMAIQLANVHTLAGHQPELIEAGLNRLAEARQPHVDEAAQAVLSLISGHYEKPAPSRPAPVEMRHLFPQDLEGDLEFFRSLALALDAKNPYWTDRTNLQINLAMELNRLAGRPVDPTQLAIAIYVHDLGMALLPEAMVQKIGKLDESEIDGIRNHVQQASELLYRMPYWLDAAEMVAQHHEWVNGKGYPFGLKEERLCEGGKLLALVDAYYAMTNPRADREHGRSLLRAVSEINACSGSQFSRRWVEIFNQWAMQKMRQTDAG